MSLKNKNNILVQKMINLTQRAILQAFFAVVSNLSTELSTDSVDNKNHEKKSPQFHQSQSVFRLFLCIFCRLDRSFFSVNYRHITVIELLPGCPYLKFCNRFSAGGKSRLVILYFYTFLKGLTHYG